jgi:hypothetical protein
LAGGVGIVVGVPVGGAVGVGETVGITVGVPVGAAVGDAEGVGETVGITVGVPVGDGVPVGAAVGDAEGVGETVGITVGAPVGDTDGVAEGVGVNPARAGVTVSKMRLSARRILSKIFERSIFSPQSPVCPHPAGHRGFISRRLDLDPRLSRCAKLLFDVRGATAHRVARVEGRQRSCASLRRHYRRIQEAHQVEDEPPKLIRVGGLSPLFSAAEPEGYDRPQSKRSSFL